MFAFYYIEENRKGRRTMSKVNVLFIEYSGTKSAGAFHSLVTLITELRKYNIEGHVALPNDVDGIELLKKNNIHYIELHACAYTWVKNKDESLKETVKHPLKKIIVYMNSFRIQKYCKDNGVSIIHENTLPCYIGYYVAKRLAIPHIWHAREFLDDDFNLEFINKKTAIKRLKSADRIICISKAVFNKFYPILGSNNLRLVYNGIGVNSFFLDRKILFSDTINILAVGRISVGKGQRTLLGAYARIQNRYPNVKITLAGSISDKNEYEYLNKYIKNNSLQDKVVFLGQVDNIQAYYSSTDIFCMSSKCEAFGRVTIEAMLAGCFIIGSNSGATTELLDNDRGLLFNAQDEVDLAQKIEWVLNNKESASNMAHDAQIYAKTNFTAEQNAKRVYNIYEEILETKKQIRKEEKSCL